MIVGDLAARKVARMQTKAGVSLRRRWRRRSIVDGVGPVQIVEHDQQRGLDRRGGEHGVERFKGEPQLSVHIRAGGRREAGDQVVELGEQALELAAAAQRLDSTFGRRQRG